uniref:Uncharacterized protein n=1 Tax=Oryza brachyantha TaxID=4533 RepID=J3LC35_ORYBR
MDESVLNLRELVMCTHLRNDPIAAVLFVKARAAAHRWDSPYLLFLHSPALAVKSATPPPEQPLLAAKQGSPDTGVNAATGMSSATFRFSAEAMRALLSSVESGTTPFAALFWLRVACGAAKERELTLTLDFRKRMQAPPPTGYPYYGTAVHFAPARADLSSGLVAAADRRVSTLSEKELWPAIEWLHTRQAAGDEPFQMDGPKLTCMALDHVPLYGAKFVAGAPPVRAACRNREVTGEGLVVVLPSAEGEAARDMVVTLPAEAMIRICHDG